MTAKIYNYQQWVSETAPLQLVPSLNRILSEAGFTILNYVEHHFEPQGFTAVWVLSESHLAIHTFPEAQKTYLELSSCSQEKNQRFIPLLLTTFTLNK